MSDDDNSDKDKNDKIKARIIGLDSNSGRWVKGKSGNPKGRPKEKKKAGPKPSATDKAIRDEALRAADSMMKLPEKGQEVEMSVRNWVGRSQTVTAIKGNALAQKYWQERDDRLRQERAAEIAEDREFWTQYVVTDYEKLVAYYKKLGEPLPEEYPHPFELLFRDDQLVTSYFGGKPREAGKTRETLRKWRDALLLQREKDHRHHCAQGMGKKLCVSEFVAILINSALAEPFRLSDIQLIMQMDRNHILKKAELESRLAAAFDGLELPKGFSGISPLMEPIIRQWGIELPNKKPPRYRRAS